MTKDDWCDFWDIPQIDRDAEWARKCAMDKQSSRSATIMADTPDFVSPIDGSIVRGRAGVRDHCARHNVVQTAELAGLPMKRVYDNNWSPDAASRAATKQTIAEVINSRNYK
jgi:hypothetical protein